LLQRSKLRFGLFCVNSAMVQPRLVTALFLLGRNF